MVGRRWFSFREGDRSEYLAQYLLSGLGIAAPVIRQEDVGIDFFCSVASTLNSGLLTFGAAYAVQIKSASAPAAEFGGAHEKSATWLGDEIKWLDELDIPLLLGVIDKRSGELSLFSTSAARLAFVKAAESGKRPAKVTLVPRLNGKNGDVTWPERSDISVAGAEIDGKEHKVDLGPAVLVIDMTLLNDPVRLDQARETLRKVLDQEYSGLVLRKSGAPYFHWLVRMGATRQPEYGWMFHTPHAVSPRLTLSVAIQCCVLASRLIAMDKQASLVNLRQALEETGFWNFIPSEIRSQLWK